MASYLYRQTTVPTSEKKFTISTWMKISADTSVEKGIIEWYRSANDRYQVLIDTTGKMRIHSQVGGSTGINIYTDMLFRDPSAWYHIVIHNDTAEGSATDRFKLWVNGEAQTFSTYSYTYNGSNINCFDGTSGDAVNVGVRDETSSKFFDGSLADTYYVDGSLIAYTQFGQTDSTSGIWKPNTSPTISSFGNAGFHLKYENSGNLGLDSSGNSLNMTASGTITQNVDTPSKNYNTLNPVIYSTTGVTLAHGNTSFNSGSGVQYGFAIPSFALNKGRWYFESKIGHTCAGLYIGDTNQVVEAVRNSTRIGVGSQQYSWECNGNFQNNNSQTSYGSTAAANDIIGMFVDLEDNKLYIAVNGTIQNSGTGFSITDPNSTETGFYYVGGIADQCSATANVTAEMNYGGGKFGVTAISSAQADANGEGIFEYSPNQGGASNFDSAAKNFYALNTKNIKEFG